jgi:hypothetical protein
LLLLFLFLLLYYYCNVWETNFVDSLFWFFLRISMLIHLYFWQYLCLNSGPHATTWATPPAPSCDGIFQDMASQAICPGWLWTTVLLISASWVARITGARHWRPTFLYFIKAMIALSLYLTLCFFPIDHFILQ